MNTDISWAIRSTFPSRFPIYSPFPHISTSDDALDVSRAAAVHLRPVTLSAVQRDAVRTDTRARLSVRQCVVRLFLSICLVSVDTDATGAIQFKLNSVGNHLQSWDASTEGMAATSFPARAQPCLGRRGWREPSPALVPPSQQTCPVSLPPRRPASKQQALQNLTSTGKQCSSWYKKDFLFWVEQLILYFFSTLPSKSRK